jgi:hypothetical protein
MTAGTNPYVGRVNFTRSSPTFGDLRATVVHEGGS